LPATPGGAAVGVAAFLNVRCFGLGETAAIFGDEPTMDPDQDLIVTKLGREITLDGGATEANGASQIAAIDAMAFGPDIDPGLEPSWPTRAAVA
jgi:hypothetical protein